MADYQRFALFVLYVVALNGLCWRFCNGYHFSISWVANPRESYNSWAGRMRFQVNDTIAFRYGNPNDSVLVVSKEGYDNCNGSNPVERLEYRNGSAGFQFLRSGPFFFISGINPSCQRGQRLIVVVMAVRHRRQLPPPALPPQHPPLMSPSGAPSPSPSGSPSASPSGSPSASPSGSPSMSPSGAPSPSPSSAPSASPSGAPTTTPSGEPSPGSSPAPGNNPSPGDGTSPASQITPDTSSPGGGGNTSPPSSLAVKGGRPWMVLVVMSIVLSAIVSV